MAGASAGDDRANLRLVRSDAHHPFGRNRFGPQQTVRFLLVLVQPRDGAQRLLPALSRPANLSGRDAALSLWRAARLAFLAALRAEPAGWGDDRHRLSRALQPRRVLDTRSP